MKKKTVNTKRKFAKKPLEPNDQRCPLAKSLGERAIRMVKKFELDKFDQDFLSPWFSTNICKFYEDVLYDPHYDVDFNRMNKDVVILYTAIGFVLRFQKTQETLVSFQDEISRFCSERAGDNILFGSLCKSASAEVEHGN